MARLRSPEKRDAILQAAVHEIAGAGLGAPTAKIARRAGVAEGTLFTYFASKDALLNELYLELKKEVYARIDDGFPHQASLKLRTRHLWSGFVSWAMEFPEKRKVSLQLNVSDRITSKTRERAATGRERIDATLRQLESRGAMKGVPKGFAAATISAMQEAAMDLVSRQPKQREKIIEGAFAALWRALS